MARTETPIQPVSYRLSALYFGFVYGKNAVLWKSRKFVFKGETLKKQVASRILQNACGGS